MKTTEQKPCSVGDILASEFGMTAIKLMHKTGLSLCYATGVMSGRQQVGPRIAKTLAKSFGNSASFWLNTELRTYLWRKEQARTSPMCQCGHRGRTHSFIPFRNGLAHVCRVSTCGCRSFTESLHAEAE
jgi:plasmid maintenance system antidote protein VapI